MLDLCYSGRTMADKISDIRNKLKHKDSDIKDNLKYKDTIYVVSKLDDIAWVLNLRGKDIHFNPVFFSYLLIS